MTLTFTMLSSWQMAVCYRHCLIVHSSFTLPMRIMIRWFMPSFCLSVCPSIHPSLSLYIFFSIDSCAYKPQSRCRCQPANQTSHFCIGYGSLPWRSVTFFFYTILYIIQVCFKTNIPLQQPWLKWFELQAKYLLRDNVSVISLTILFW